MTLLGNRLKSNFAVKGLRGCNHIHFLVEFGGNVAIQYYQVITLPQWQFSQK